jgi:hypothetical protein
MNRKEICELLGLSSEDFVVDRDVNIGWLMARVYSAIQLRNLALSNIENCGLSFVPVIASDECILMMSDCGRIIALTGDQYGVVQSLYAAEVYAGFLSHNKLHLILPAEIIEEIKRLEALEDEAARQYNRDREIAKLQELATKYPEALQ